MPERDELAATVRAMRLTAQGDFLTGTDQLVTEIRRFATAASSAIGEISVDEAWGGLRRVVEDFFDARGVVRHA